MQKTKAEFIERWKKHIAGLALYGYISEAKDPPRIRVEKVYDIPAEVEKLLGQLYDDLAVKAVNGKAVASDRT